MQLLKYTCFDNSNDTLININPTKKQIGFLPKEEYQMFQGVSFGGVTSASTVDTAASDYIGAIGMNTRVVISDDFVDVNYIKNNSEWLPVHNSGEEKIITVNSRVQYLKIPLDLFKEILTDELEISLNKGSNIKWLYNTYQIYLEPKYVEVSVEDVIPHTHDGTSYRRTIIEVNKNNLYGSVWDFESNPLQSGRLYGSVVEIWDNTKTVLKQTKIITENRFNFADSNNSEFVLSPDIVGYDTESQAITVGDILRVYPRETYFEPIVIDFEFKDELNEASTFISYMLNDVVRDIQTGIYEIYDKSGFVIDETGSFNGNVVQRYQTSQHNNYEIRKKLK